MRLGGLTRVVRGVLMVRMGDVRVMRRLVLIARFVVPRRFPMMAGGVFVVLRGFVMVFDSVFHRSLPSKLNVPM
ncbi:MAG TPA: hypothetical protein VEG84_06845 [Thermoanaerobaculia bacterium]|nr:hypothetical protein [Thermoanaerobaculia bacterium]